MELAIRDATPADAAAVRGVAIEAWPATYAGLLPDDFIARVLEATYALEPLARLIAEAEVFLVAEIDGEPVGYLHYGDGPHGPELHRLYLLPSATGKGVGPALLAELNSRLEPGTSYVALVHHDNAGALRFYEREGFVPAGTIDGPSFYMRREGLDSSRVEAESCDVFVRYVVPVG